jgi:hypothetical protein
MVFRFAGFIEDGDGKPSSKRLCGVGAFFVASIVVLIEALKEAPFDNGLMWAYATSFAGAVAIGTATEKIVEQRRDRGALEEKDSPSDNYRRRGAPRWDREQGPADAFPDN